MRTRNAARVVLLDPFDRVLLFNIEDATVYHPEKSQASVFWVTPGGSLLVGETFEEAARREIYEETGIQDFMLGSWVWTREQVLHWKGELLISHERYYLGRTSCSTIALDLLHDQEIAVYCTDAWWSLKDLQHCTAVLYPQRFSELLGDLLSGKSLREPLHIE